LVAEVLPGLPEAFQQGGDFLVAPPLRIPPAGLRIAPVVRQQPLLHPLLGVGEHQLPLLAGLVRLTGCPVVDAGEVVDELLLGVRLRAHRDTSTCRFCRWATAVFFRACGVRDCWIIAFGEQGKLVALTLRAAAACGCDCAAWDSEDSGT